MARLLTINQLTNALIEKILKAMDEHFIKLRDSDREEIRGYYPGKTAEEMFLRK